MTRIVAVTGSTGFIGRHFCRWMLDRGWRVRSVLRPATSQRPPDRCETVISRLRADELERALTGCSVIVHLAGQTRAPNLSAYLLANAEATQQIAMAARRIGARLVYVSSLAAAGTGTRAQPRTESDAPDPISDYGRSKLAGEEAVRSIERLDYTILRPSAVYGPGDRDFLQLVRWARRGIFPRIGRTDAEFSFLYVADLVRALDIAATHPDVSSEEFFVAHPETHSATEFLRLLAEQFDKTYRPIPIPRALIWAAMVGGLVASRFGADPLLSPSRFRELTSIGFVCTVSKLEDTTGFTASTPLDVGIGLTCDWYTHLSAVSR